MAIEPQQEFGGVPWVVTPGGVVPLEPMRTPGEPYTMRTYLRVLGQVIEEACAVTGVPVEIMLMVLATENGPAKLNTDGTIRVKEPRVRMEKGYVDDEETPDRVSVGPMHVLIETARFAMEDPSIDRAWLLDIRQNLLAAATYIEKQHPITRYDPVRVAAAYNAGRVIQATDPASKWYSRWHVKAWPGHLDRAMRWYGDACAVLNS